MLIDRLIIQFDKGLRNLLTQQECPLASAKILQPLATSAAAIKRKVDQFRTPNSHHQEP